MTQSSNFLAPSPSSNGPLRRNQACHQCRARKLKCDAGRPCSTCKRSHAKAVASLTSAGQAVLEDPCCTYDYAPGEDPWTATLRNGLRNSPPRSGSISPGSFPNKLHASPAGEYKILVAEIEVTTDGAPKGMSTSAPLPSPMHAVGPMRSRRGTSSRKHSPTFTPPGRAQLLTPDSAYAGSPTSPGIARSTGAHGTFSSSLTDMRGLPALTEPTSLIHAMPSYVLPQSFNPVHHDLEYEEMAEMLYNPMGPLPDSPPLFSPLPPYVNPLLNGVSPGNEAPLYAHDMSASLPLEPRLFNPTGGALTHDAGDLDYSFLATDFMTSHRHEPTQ